MQDVTARRRPSIFHATILFTASAVLLGAVFWVTPADAGSDSAGPVAASGDMGSPVESVDLSLVEPLTAEQMQGVDLDYGLIIDYVSATYTAPDNDVITVGVSANEAGDLPLDLNGEVIETLTDLQLDQTRASQLDPKTGFSTAADPASLPTEMEGYSNDVAMALSLARDGKLLFNQAVVRQLPVTLPVTIAKPAALEEEVYSDDDGSFAGADGTCGANWSPYWAQTRVHRSSVDYHRYAVVDFYWGLIRMRNAKCRMNAIEPDFILNNYDQTYVCGEYGCWAQPQTYMRREIVAWATNMPRGYKDTQASDSEKEMTFTVGSQGVDRFRKRKHYFTYVRARNGLQSRDNGKLNFQDMKRCSWWFDGISPAWGLCADQTAKYIPAWEAGAPGDTTYSFG